MAEFILKDWYGKDQVFDKETIYVQGTDGELMPFTHGAGSGGASTDVCYVTFMDEDGTEEYGKKAVAVGDDCADPIARGVFDTPKTDQTLVDAYFEGWSDEVNGSLNIDALKAIVENKTVYAVFNKVAILASGICNESVAWRLKEDGVLSIYGEGDMGDFPLVQTNTPNSPWKEYVNSIKSVEIGNGVTTVGSYAFFHCINLSNVKLPNSIVKIGMSAFNTCSSLTSINFPSSVAEIGSYAFQNAGLTSINISDNVTTLGSSAFMGCENLESVTIPGSIETINTYTFRKCYKLARIIIPNGINNIGAYAFQNCDALTSVIFKNTSGWWYGSRTDTSGTSVPSADVANASTMATYLKSTYTNMYWHRS